jgi:hypothetical protein
MLKYKPDAPGGTMGGNNNPVEEKASAGSIGQPEG